MTDDYGRARPGECGHRINERYECLRPEGHAGAHAMVPDGRTDAR